MFLFIRKRLIIYLNLYIEGWVEIRNELLKYANYGKPRMQIVVFSSNNRLVDMVQQGDTTNTGF